MSATTVTLAERPDLTEAMWAMPDTWQPFMLEDPIVNAFFGRLPEEFAEYQLVALGPDDTVIAKVHSVPFAWSADDDDLPDRGVDGVLIRAFGDQRSGRATNAVSLAEAHIDPAYRGRGLSAELLRVAMANARRLGAADLLGPVRPTGKELEPRTPMTDYVARMRPDGLPTDGWVRTHVRLGGRIVKVCPASMTIPGSLTQWRSWTGLPFDTSGLTEVGGALVPVTVSVEQDHAVYVEPNVWIHHPLVGR
jgi:GNAT superfamily N-acetyltransferase